MANLVKQLEELSSNNPDAFPERGSINYNNAFKQLSDFLNTHVHSEVEKAALARDASEVTKVLENIQKHIEMGNDVPAFNIPEIVYLTDHGPKHIQTVIRRASDLVYHMDCKLTPYEIYVLLAAIHLHDVGNMFGRDNHETRIADAIESFKVPLIDDVAERKIIRRIAAAHGGKLDGDKDTIGRLPEHDYVQGCKVRMQYLAAILRFADELADDKTRASKLGAISVAGSEMYHAYAKQLESVTIEERRVELKFNLSKSEIVQLFSKGNERRFLIDEIFERTLKMHFESVYCMRFIRNPPEPKFENIEMSQWFSRPKTIDTIKVEIEVYIDFNKDDLPLLKIEYPLKEKGYPQYSSQDIHSICPEINRDFTTRFGWCAQVDGSSVKRAVEET